MARLFKENLKNIILEYISKLKNDPVLKLVEIYKPLMLMLITEKRFVFPIFISSQEYFYCNISCRFCIVNIEKYKIMTFG